MSDIQTPALLTNEQVNAYFSTLSPRTLKRLPRVPKPKTDVVIILVPKNGKFKAAYVCPTCQVLLTEFRKILQCPSCQRLYNAQDIAAAGKIATESLKPAE